MQYLSQDPIGDPHNFGRRVSVGQSLKGPVILKPRTMFWEHMFLDSSSQFRKFLRQLPDSVTDQYLGAVQVFNSESFDEGYANLYDKDGHTNVRFNPINLENFGRIVAFSTVYGLTDLHLDNLIITPSKLQLLDVECVFSLVESPLDSLLVPARDFDKSRSVFSNITDSSVRPYYEYFILGLFKEFNFLREHQRDLIEFHSSAQQVYGQIPIRFLLRPSNEYSMNGRASIKFPFLRAELEQLVRGDVPYFFGFMDKNGIYYKDSPSTSKQVNEELPNFLMTKILRSFQKPSILLDPARLLRVQKQSIMMTISKLLLKTTDFRCSSDQYVCKAFDGHLRFTCEEFDLVARLSSKEGSLGEK